MQRQLDKILQELLLPVHCFRLSKRALIFRTHRVPRVKLATDTVCTRIVIVLTQMANVFNNII